jgi:hypothetical protein
VRRPYPRPTHPADALGGHAGVEAVEQRLLAGLELREDLHDHLVRDPVAGAAGTAGIA